MLDIRVVYKKSLIVFICMFFAVVLVEKNAYAEKNKIFSNTGLNLPRFVSIAKNTANVRSGPGQKYPVKWTINRKELPVEVILEFDHWRKIRDLEGDEGWVFHTLLSGKRYAVIIGSDNAIAYDSPIAGNRKKPSVSMYLEPGSVVRLMTCNGAWCEVETADLSGWIKRKSLWGVYETENID
ncbi:MAG: SH3 domain-containing protein [Alphaproteobacteria bacterium]